ncbi:MAG: acetylornithine deacetylase, partial [Myxococcales bacterium]|nr:acetylornithine deacetylase [Myxococcales bacterium]
MTALPDSVELVRQLVAEPSVSSPDPRHDRSNRTVIDRLATWCEDAGLRVEVLPL